MPQTVPSFFFLDEEVLLFDCDAVCWQPNAKQEIFLEQSISMFVLLAENQRRRALLPPTKSARRTTGKPTSPLPHQPDKERGVQGRPPRRLAKCQHQQGIFDSPFWGHFFSAERVKDTKIWEEGIWQMGAFGPQGIFQSAGGKGRVLGGSAAACPQLLRTLGETKMAVFKGGLLGRPAPGPKTNPQRRGFCCGQTPHSRRHPLPGQRSFSGGGGRSILRWPIFTSISLLEGLATFIVQKNI